MNDILHGGDEISQFLGVDRQRVWTLAREGRLPIFYMGKNINARKSTLLEWMAAQEAQAFPELKKDQRYPPR